MLATALRPHRLTTALVTRGRHSKPLAERRAERAEVSDPEVVLAAALRFLEARQRSTAEVRRRLAYAGYGEELVTGAIERLTELGMLDDAAFAQAWVESRDRARPRGQRSLRRELAVKGIDRAIVDSTMGDRDVESPDAEVAAAERLLARHARNLERMPDRRARRQRAYALLARNGFDSETAISVIRANLDGGDAVDDEAAIEGRDPTSAPPAPRRRGPGRRGWPRRCPPSTAAR